MDAKELKKAAVLGAGTMGNGIAQVCAQAGMEVVLFDIADEPLARGLANIDRMLAKGVERGKMNHVDAEAVRARVSGSTLLPEAVTDCDLVIEAVPERLELKQVVFRKVEAAAPERAILASNTSSLSINKIADALDFPQRFLGLHFFNPVPIMKLLEIVVGEKTSDEVLSCARGLSDRLSKDGIVVKDAPGFASSRLGLAIGLEAMRMVEEGVASAADIDTAMVRGYGFPMGPLKLTDLVGLDVRLGISEYLASTLGPRFDPPKLLREMVATGKLGKKSGRGFYDWSE
ncbi:MAG: 3-hydroxyacyl-CoA dehydrogenase family protein [Planctomycetes bacterium]|nr:3-hydroxyacyl-CoA dehydrogenase family protein [Planctomycetota bacterium]